MSKGLIYLTLDQVLEYHSMALGAAPGAEGLRSYEGLASAVYQPRQTFGDLDLYPTLGEKAAAYAFFIAEAQAFLDGNKRTASIAMLAFLKLNGCDLYQTNEEIENMMVALGDPDSDIDQAAFFEWVKAYAKSLPATSC